MARFIVRRRPDGLIQLRRRRIWHLISRYEAAAIFILTAACLALTALLVGALIARPSALALAAPILAVGLLALWAVRVVRAPSLAPAPLNEPPRPPRKAA